MNFDDMFLEGTSIRVMVATAKKWFENKLERCRDLKSSLILKIKQGIRKIKVSDFKGKKLKKDVEVVLKEESDTMKLGSKDQDAMSVYNKIKELLNGLARGIGVMLDKAIDICKSIIKGLGFETTSMRKEREREEADEDARRQAIYDAEYDAQMERIYKRNRVSDAKEKVDDFIDGAISYGNRAVALMKIANATRSFCYDWNILGEDDEYDESTGISLDDNLEFFFEDGEQVPPQQQPHKPMMPRKTILNRLTNIADKATGFMAKQVKKVEKGIHSVNTKLSQNPLVKAVDDLSLEAIEALRVPKQICKAGNDFNYIQKSLGGWFNPILNGLNTEGQKLANEAKKGASLAQSGREKEASQSLSICQQLIKSITGAMAAVGNGFRAIWDSIRTAVGVKQEEVISYDDFTGFLTEDDELDNLLDEIY